jgi:uncharacterized protein YecE (DUF72 family)
MIKIGCADFPIPPSKYFKEWRLVEIQQTLSRFPGEGTVQRWLAEAPAGFEFVVVASPLITTEPGSPNLKYQELPRARGAGAFGGFRLNDVTRGALSRTHDLAADLKAQLVLFQTPPEFNSSRAHLEQMRKFFDAVDRGEFTYVWEPLGNWAPKTVLKISESLDLIPCINPLEFEPLPEGLTAYFHLNGPAGFRSRYEQESLEELVGICSGYDEVYCVFTNIDMHNDTMRLRRILERDQR